jgi:hypothetical protein
MPKSLKAKNLKTKNPKRKGLTQKPPPPRPPRVPPPFQFPAKHRRVHGPGGHLNYGAYKPWLRDEFEFRCVYCLTRELWSDQGQYGFTIDHVKPKSVHAHLIASYDNLVYACFRCNTMKSTKVGLPDPCKVSLAMHVKVSLAKHGELQQGIFFGVTPAGKRMVAYLQLNHDVRLPLRRRALRDYQQRKMIDPKDLLETFGYPKDLPDLTQYRPPGGNSRPGGLTLSHFARQRAGKLPPYY